MNVTQNIREAYAEVDEFIELLDKETREKIPKNVRMIFKEQKDEKYVKHINPDIDVRGQNLKEDTLAIIALLNLKYICEDEAEKERLMLIYKENERRYEEVMKVGFDSKNVFEQNIDHSQKSANICEPPKSLQIKKKSIIKNIINKLKHILKNK